MASAPFRGRDDWDLIIWCCDTAGWHAFEQASAELNLLERVAVIEDASIGAPLRGRVGRPAPPRLRVSLRNETRTRNALTAHLGPRPTRPHLTISRSARTDVQELLAKLGPRGKRVVESLCFQIFKDEYANVELGWVGEGYSSSVLFKLTMQGDGDAEAIHVLKLTPIQERDDVERELRTDLQGGTRRNAAGQLGPAIRGSSVSGMDPLPACSDDWVAVAYEFLGGKAEFCDLGKAYSSYDDTTCFGELHWRGEDPAEVVLDGCLDMLRDRWYCQPAFEERVLWQDVVPEPPRSSAPVYGLKQKQKKLIAQCLAKLDRYGDRLSNDWRKSAALVRQLLWRRSSLRSELFNGETRATVMLTPVHGDLNAGNILFDVSARKPFLIDFAKYRPRDHIIRDIARLEAEVKFRFMDWGESPLTPDTGDLNPALVGSWLRAERVLLADSWDVVGREGSKSLDFTRIPLSSCASRAMRLVKLIRAHAHRIQQTKQTKMMGDDVPDFEPEEFSLGYRVALLYWTLRTIVFEALPFTKRIYAVGAAAGLIRDLQRT